MRELSLFSGVGGGLLGSLLLGWRPVGYVEFDGYCQRVIAQRIRDGILPDAPIFGDIRTFVSEGYAASYQGMVDVISGGFPCQPFSVAGKRKGADDERNMWPATIATVRAVRPRYCYFENVPGLLNSGYFGRIVADLAESGYSVKWRCLSAAELGANHRRNRLWILATNTNGERREGSRTQALHRFASLSWGENIRSLEDIIRRSDIPEPLIRRVVDGLAFRVDRLKAIGNGQVSIVAATAWRLLTEATNA
jgi:DNA (cytosine-5)-methyltransferase 1